MTRCRGCFIDKRFKGVRDDEKFPLVGLPTWYTKTTPGGIFNLSLNFDKSNPTGEPADRRCRGTRCLFANVHRALMNLDGMRRGAPDRNGWLVLFFLFFFFFFVLSSTFSGIIGAALCNLYSGTRCLATCFVSRCFRLYWRSDIAAILDELFMNAGW